MTTPRETTIWRMVAEGRTSRAIAFHLDLTQKTVENHRQRIMAKVGARTVADLTRAAVAHGIVPVPTRETWRVERLPIFRLTVTPSCVST